jgi:DNA-binding MarR family transcriptional regulator
MNRLWLAESLRDSKQETIHWVKAMRSKIPQGLYIPAPKLNQLHILKQIAAHQNVTQAELAEQCALSVAMVNNYMKELSDQGLLEYRRKNTKTISYHVTAAGKEVILATQNELLQELSKLFASAKEQMQEMIISQTHGNLQRVVLYGSGILAEIAFHALESARISVVGVCSDDPAEVGQEWCGREKINPSQIRFMAPDAVVVALGHRSEEMDRELAPLYERGIQLIYLGCHAPESTAGAMEQDSIWSSPAVR